MNQYFVTVTRVETYIVKADSAEGAENRVEGGMNYSENLRR